MAAKVPEAGSQNRGWYYTRKPTSPEEQVASKIFEYKDVPGGIPAMKDGDFMCRTLAVGIAPHAICFLDLPGSDTGAEMSGLKRCKVGEAVKSEWIGEVIASKSKKFLVGERVSCFSELADYAVLNESQKTPPPNKIPPFLQTENALGLGAALTAHMMKYRDNDSNEIADEPESWQPFYKAMCEEAIQMNNGSSTGVLVSHSLYRKSHREFVKECLGAAGLFLVLTPPPALALKRAAIRCADQYSTMGKSVEEWEQMLEMNSAGFQEYDPESEKQLKAMILANDGTEQTVDELLASAEKLLGL